LNLHQEKFSLIIENYRETVERQLNSLCFKWSGPGGKEASLIETVKNLDRDQFACGIITFKMTIIILYWRRNTANISVN